MKFGAQWFVTEYFSQIEENRMSPSANTNVVHRPGVLKQQNKPFKTGRHRSQHEIKRNTKGFY